MKKLISILIMLLSGLPGFTQERQGLISGKIVGNAKPYPDRISLRWNINDYRLIQLLATEGVQIQRQTIDTATGRKSPWQIVSRNTIKAWSLERISKTIPHTDTASLIIAQCLYGKSKIDSNASLIERIQKEQYDWQNRHTIIALYSLLSPRAATMAGLAFDDSLNVDASKNYLYRIIPLTNRQGYRIDTGYIIAVGADIYRREFLLWLTAQGGDKAITLQWSAAYNHFNGYHVERSDDGKHYTRITRKPFLPGKDTTLNTYSYTDSVANYRKYYYRLIGLNSFGEEIVSNDIVNATAKDQTPPDAPFLTGKLDGNKALLKWKPCTEPDTKGYYIVWGRSKDKADSMVQPQLLPPSTKEYTYSFPAYRTAAYFRIVVVDTANNYSMSDFIYLAMPDLTPPKPPSGLRGSIDSLGHITLRWDRDTTDQIKGYKVFLANQSDHRFAAISNIIDQDTFSYTTTLQTLSSKVHFKIVAVDQNFNHSQFSEELILTRRDTIPPPEPVFNDYSVINKTVTLHWGEVGASDFSNFVLYRRENVHDAWSKVSELKGTQYSDSMLKEKTSYEYSLIAVDVHGLRSKMAMPIYIFTGLAPKTENVTVHIKKEQGQVIVTWTPSSYNTEQTWLYKNSGEGLTLFKVVEKNQHIFREKEVSEPKSYAVKYIYTDGSESEIYHGVLVR